MCIPQEDRQKPLLFRDNTHFYQRLHEKGHKLFGAISPAEMINECIASLRDPMRSAFVEDARGKNNTHQCIFISDSGGYVSLPCHINEEHLILITIEDIRESDQPMWYIREYNKIAETRKLQRMNYICKDI